MLNLFRSMQPPRWRLLRNTMLSALGMAAIVVGLLAMHSAGTEHANLAEVSAAIAHSPETPAVLSHGAATVVAVSSVMDCDSHCMQGVMDCALMAISCAMLFSIAAFVLFAHRPGMFRALLDAGGRAVLQLRRATPAHLLRPDLIVLSISRT